MKTCLILAAVTALSLAAPVGAAPVVEVAFIDPARYTDAATRGHLASERERDATLAELRTHLYALGAKFLKDGDRLALEVLDVDLAGNFEPTGEGGRHERLLFDVTVPRIQLRYTLVRGGVEFAGEERLTDLGYLQRLSTCRSAAGLCYEKRMVDEWFARLVAGRITKKPQ